MELPQDFEVQVDPSKVSVTEDGRKVMRPDILNFLMLASINAQAAKVRRYFDDRASRGLTETWGSEKPLTVTDDFTPIRLDSPAQSGSLINDGGNDVYIWINSLGRRPHEVQPGEAYNFDFEIHKIEFIYLKCDKGEETTVRIVVNE